MKKIVTIISGCLVGFAAVAAESSASQIFQMRLVADKPSSQTERMTVVGNRQGTEGKEVLYVQKAVLLDQTDLRSAAVNTNTPGGAPVIEITFTDSGAKRFSKVTRQNIGRRLAIVIDGQVYSAPVIRTEIVGGKGQISGSFSEQEARDLAAKISKALRK